MILFEKFGQHPPLNRQSERCRREGIELRVSTFADQVGACATVLLPILRSDRAPCLGGLSGSIRDKQ
jgi:transposase